MLHLALFVPWERFQGELADDLPGLWRSFEERLSDRLRSYVRNIALLRVSADDAKANRKLQGLSDAFEEIIENGGTYGSDPSWGLWELPT